MEEEIMKKEILEKGNAEKEVAEKEITEKGITEKEIAEKNTGILWDKWLRILIRAFFSLVSICLLVYLYLGIEGGGGFSFIVRIRIYFDALTPVLQGAAVLLILFLSGMVLDFLNGFRLAVTSGKDAPLDKIQRAIEAVSCAGRTAVIAGFLLFMADLLNMLSNLYVYENFEKFWSLCHIPLGILSFDIIYPALFLLVLTPVKARLKCALCTAEDRNL